MQNDYIAKEKSKSQERKLLLNTTMEHLFQLGVAPPLTDEEFDAARRLPYPVPVPGPVTLDEPEDQGRKTKAVITPVFVS